MNWDADLGLKGWEDVDDVRTHIAQLKASVLAQHAPGLVIAERLADQLADLQEVVAGLQQDVRDLRAEVAKLRLGVPAELAAPAAPAKLKAARVYRSADELARINRERDRVMGQAKAGVATNCVVCGADIRGLPRGKNGRRLLCAKPECDNAYTAARRARKRLAKRTDARVRSATAVVAGHGVRKPNGSGDGV